MDADNPKEVANDLVEQLVAGKPVDELQGPGLYQSVSDEKQEAINTLKIHFEESIKQAGTLSFLSCSISLVMLFLSCHAPCHALCSFLSFARVRGALPGAAAVISRSCVDALCGVDGWRAVSQLPNEILAKIDARSASRTAQTSQAPPPAEMSMQNPDQSEAGGAERSVPPCTAAPPSAADTSLLPAVHAAVASIVPPTPATSAPLPPALDGVAAASGVAQGAGGGEDTSRAQALAGNGTQVTKAHATAAHSATPASGAASPLCAAAISAGAHSSGAAVLAGLTPFLGNAFAGVAGAGVDVHSADDAVGNNPLMNASTSHCEGGSGLEQVQGKSAGTAVPAISHASDHSPSQINPPQPHLTAEGRLPDMSQDARLEEMERRLNDLWETYLRRRRELNLEHQNAFEQLGQDYGDLAPADQPFYASYLRKMQDIEAVEADAFSRVQVRAAMPRE